MSAWARLSAARRAGLIDFDAIRDDDVTREDPFSFDGISDFMQAIERSVDRYALQPPDRPAGVEIG